MKFILKRTPGCGSSYDLCSIYDGNRNPINKQVTDFGNFTQGEYGKDDCYENIQNISKTLVEKMRKMGDDPIYEEAREIYDLLYNEIKPPQYFSKYTQEIENIIYSVYRNNKNDDQLFGFFAEQNGNQYMIFQSSGKNCELTPGMKIYVLHISNDRDGYCCMTTTLPIAIFTDESQCENFKEKVEDVIKSYESGIPNDFGWDECMKVTYTLKDDAKTFR